MNRRGFLAGLAALVGGLAIEQAIPFGRVWSFPKNIVIAKPPITSVAQAIGMMHKYIRPKLPRLYVNEEALLKRMSRDMEEAWNSVGVNVCALQTIQGETYYVPIRHTA